MNWLDLFDDNAETDRRLHREHARTIASEPCDDDCEVTAFLVNVMPDESYNHLIHTGRAIDLMIEKAFISGC